jgi:hypothetical protein
MSFQTARGPLCAKPDLCNLQRPNREGESPMAKGQMKSNKEKRKPKKDKDDKKGAKK